MASYNDANWRLTFPEFANTTTYPQATVQMYWNIGTDFILDPSACFDAMLGPNQLQYANDLLAAHLLVLAQQAASSTPPGQEQGGFVTSASIDKISVQKLAPPAKDMFGWWLAQTPYGQQISALLELCSVGGIGVGGMPERAGFRKVGGVFW